MLGVYFAEGIHVSLRAEPLFKLGPLTVTNSIVYGLLVSFVLFLFLYRMSKRVTVKPQKGVAGPLEVIVEYILNLIEGPLGSRANAVKYAPIFASFFLFIIASNVTGLLPLVGPGFTLMVDDVKTYLFRPFTADLNGTIAMAVIAIITVQILSIRAQGTRNHLKHYFTDKPFNPINMFIGVLEVFGEFTRMVSLSLRLFLNTAVGEILISVFTSMVLSGGRTPFAVIPILLFEVLVAGIQAYVFTVLTATYLGIAIAHHHEHDEHDDSNSHAFNHDTLGYAEVEGSTLSSSAHGILTPKVESGQRAVGEST